MFPPKTSRKIPPPARSGYPAHNPAQHPSLRPPGPLMARFPLQPFPRLATAPRPHETAHTASPATSPHETAPTCPATAPLEILSPRECPQAPQRVPLRSVVSPYPKLAAPLWNKKRVGEVSGPTKVKPLIYPPTSSGHLVRSQLLSAKKSFSDKLFVKGGGSGRCSGRPRHGPRAPMAEDALISGPGKGA